MSFFVKRIVYSLNESHYEPNGAATAAQRLPVHVPDGTGISYVHVGHV
jgi:hypothetical protein